MCDLKKIKSLYLQSGYKEEHYAFEIGISQSHFSNCLSGKRNFSKKALEKIAQLHNCSINDLDTIDGIATEDNRSSRIKKLSQVEIDNIEKIVALLERQSLLNDHRIRQAYHRLMDMIVFKREGSIENDW